MTFRTTQKKTNSTKEQEEKLIEKFKNEIKDDTLKIEVQSLKDDSIPAVILLGESVKTYAGDV